MVVAIARADDVVKVGGEKADVEEVVVVVGVTAVDGEDFVRVEWKRKAAKKLERKGRFVVGIVCVACSARRFGRDEGKIGWL